MAALCIPPPCCRTARSWSRAVSVLPSAIWPLRKPTIQRVVCGPRTAIYWYARSDHTATLLTNGLVLVAGGDNFSGQTNEAELYNPATGTWTATGSMTNARTWHAAALLPNGKVLVAGGYNSVSYLTNCELYNAATGTWTNTGSLNYARIQFTLTVLPSGKVLAVGGDGGGICELYDPVAGTWAITGTNAIGHQNHTATLLTNGLVLVAGGSGDNTAELYNPATGLWTNTGNMMAIRYNPTATLLPNGQVLVAGGFTNDDATVMTSTELYDPVSGTWSTNLDMINLRAQHTATLLPGGNVLLAGGYDGTNEVSSAELYALPPAPPAPGIWTVTGSLTNAPYLNTATLLPGGKVLVTGGSDNSGNASAGVQLYNPATGTWQGTNAMHQARFAHTAILLTNGLVLVAGGNTATGAVQTAELFNPGNATWTMTGPLNFPRYGHTASLLANGKVLVAGGMGTNLPDPYVYPTEVYDPATGLWTTNGSLLVGRSGHTATLLLNGTVLITGGETTNRIIATEDCELFDPATGLCTATGLLPYPIANHTATLLPDGQVLAAAGDIDIGTFGGFSLVPYNGSALYDPNAGTWTQMANLNKAHDYHTATLLTNGVVLVAGYSTFNSTNVSAELYSPALNAWFVAAPMNFPRIQHTATLLPNGQVLVEGGLVATAELYSATAAATLPIRLLNATKLAGGAFQFSFTNTPGVSFTVLSTTNLSLSVTNWSVLGTATDSPPGTFQFTDPQATNGPKRFYRVRSP